MTNRQIAVVATKTMIIRKMAVMTIDGEEEEEEEDEEEEEEEFCCQDRKLLQN